MGAIQAITAAAARIITGKSRKANSGSANGLQTVAWDMYEQVPEVGAYGDLISNMMQGARLYAGVRQPDGTVEELPGDSRAAELVSSIAGGMDGQSQVLADFGTNLAVAGEGWLVIVPDPDADSFAGDKWYVLSSDEVKPQRGKFKVVIENEERDIPEYDPDVPQDPDTPVIIRVWKQSPRRKWQATSPVIRAITVLEELRLLNAAVAAIARSRITGRGVLLVPAGTGFPGTKNQEGAGDSLLETFIEVASTSIREPESAAATVPIVLEVPGDMINGVKWLQFSSDFDALARELRDEAVRRFATGADVPAEVLLGLGDASHWGAWALTAEALKMGAEPRLGLVCQALTAEWLRPLLEAESDPNARDAMVWYDTSGLRSSSNKGASALEAFMQGLISAAAARRELGFTDADAPEDGDRQQAQQDPETTEGADLPVNETQAPPAEPGVTGQRDAALAASGKDDGYADAVRRATSLSMFGDNPTLDSFTADTTAALAAAVDGLVWAALAVAGRKLMQTPACPRPARAAARELAASASVHTKHPVPGRVHVTAWRLLEDAWVRVPEVAARYGMDDVRLTAALDDYVTALLITGQPHVFDNVPRMLAQMKVARA